MNQSVIVKEVTQEKLVAKLESIIERDLSEIEVAIMEYAIEQIRLGLV
jgi:nitrogen regulatory protein PII-like uncharacterized protein